MERYLIITIDTEGDGLWSYKKGDTITTHNSKYVPRFQELCEKYGFKPIYLTNYEMLRDDEFVTYIRNKEQKGLCEIGLHLHAWNNPPIFELEGLYTGNPYLIEYPNNVMRAKFDHLYQLFCDKIGHKPVSHRSGRWAMDKRYFKLLAEYSVKVDCSVTPHVDWSRTMGVTRGGSDYSAYKETPHFIEGVYEVPLTVIPSKKPLASSLKANISRILRGKQLQLRPATFSLREMKYVIDASITKHDPESIVFMMHSSEMMPGGSPYFADESSIERMYIDLEALFRYAKEKEYKGVTLQEYYQKKYRSEYENWLNNIS